MGGSNSKDEHWQSDSEAPICHNCSVLFSIKIRRHHCRNCGYVFCQSCSPYSCALPMRGVQVPVRVCTQCFRTLTKNTASPGYDGTYSSGWQGRTCTAPTHCEEYDTSVSGHHGNLVASEASVSSGSGNDARHFIGSGGTTERGATDSVLGIEVPCDIGLRCTESATAVGMMGEKMTSQLEKERLVQRWVDVRQRAVFTDILLQEVEKVEVDTEVVYCLEIEGIKLQPEHPEFIHVMFPFPQPTEGNAVLMMEPVDRCVLPFREARNTIDCALRELTKQITFPPFATVHKSESALLHQF